MERAFAASPLSSRLALGAALLLAASVIVASWAVPKVSCKPPVQPIIAGRPSS